MKHFKFLTLILIFIFPVVSNAQWKRETGFTFGVVNPNYPNGTQNDEKVGVLMKLGIDQSWYNQKSCLSLRPEIGLNVESFYVDLTSGGQAIQYTSEGTILSFNTEFAILSQLRLSKRLSIAIGPAAKYLLTDMTRMTHKSSPDYQLTGFQETVEENHGFNRKYLNKPSIGIKAMLIKKSMSEKINLGLAFDYQWKKAFEDYFYFSKTAEVSLYLGLE